MRVEFRSGNEQKEGQGFLGLYTFVNFTQRFSDIKHQGKPEDLLFS
jgi:hypothetical protein